MAKATAMVPARGNIATATTANVSSTALSLLIFLLLESQEPLLEEMSVNAEREGGKGTIGGW